MPADAPYDLVVYGATGFTGRQVAGYLAAHAPQTLRWAVAGRDATRLSEVATAFAGPEGPRPQLVVDSADAESVAELARQARIVVTTVGPYARYGTPIVEACVAQGTHYLDITGETAWVREMIDAHHDAAAAAGLRIVPCCGFDSVPSDLGTHVAVRHLAASGRQTRRVRAFHRGRGGVNGGTIHSFLTMAELGGTKAMRDPILLNPTGLRGGDRQEAEPDPLLPFYEPELGALVAPFVMGQINTRVVRRSAALAEQRQEAYGDGFRYQEYWKCEGLLGPAEALGFTWGQALTPLITGIPALRRLAQRALPPPGSGPSEATMDAGFFRCELVADADDGQRILVEFADRGDPGNRATVKMLTEGALALALNGDALPPAAGVLTPASAFGDVLAERLRGAGMTIAVKDPWP